MKKQDIFMLFVLCIYLMVSSYTAKADTPITVQVIEVHDGDTFFVSFPGILPVLGARLPVRVKGIDTPELRGKCPEETTIAVKAKAVANAFLNSSPFVELSNLERDKYFRLLADVKVRGQSLAEYLLKNNLAVPYDGKAKKEWCRKVGENYEN